MRKKKKEKREKGIKRRSTQLSGRHVILPEAMDVETPGRRDFAVRFEHPTLWGHYLVPVTVFVGPQAQKGRGLVAIGSNHGNEYEGPVAIKHLLREIRIENVIGRVILIPVLNVMAFKAGTRDTPDDGVNLNRAFPGDSKGSITYRIADFVNRFIFPNVHIVLDLHAGGLVARFHLCTSFHQVADREQRKIMERTARDFGTPFTMLYQDVTPGLLPSTAEKLGKITVGTELGWGQAVNAQGVAMAKRGILAAAIRQRQMQGEIPENRFYSGDQQRLVDTTDPASSILAPFDGHFEPVSFCGDVVERGQLLGCLHDFNHLDDPPEELRAPHDGYVVCQAWEAKVFRGQVILQVGKPVDWMS